MSQELGFFSPDLAAAIGLEEAVIFNKLQWCVENPAMSGTIAPDGIKMIRNPILCTNPRKLNKSHGKQVDWLGNFPWLSAHKLRRIFARLEKLGLIVVRQLRANYFDQCKYYAVSYEKLAELLKGAPLSICAKPSNRSPENDPIDLATERKSYQDTSSKKVFQEISPGEAGGTIDKFLEIEKENEEKRLLEDSLLEAKVVAELLKKNEFLEKDRCSVRSSPVERQLFFERLLEYCYQRVDIDSPEGYANWVMRESKAKVPEASVALLWEEFISGEELGSRLVPPGFRLRGVPEQVVAEAIAQDCINKVGATTTEAAKNAAGQLRRLPVVAAVANAVKLGLERAIEDATRQVELGVPKERAIANNLPTYAIACVETSLPELEPTTGTDLDPATEEEEAADPYAPTPESLAARERARSLLNKRFGRPTKAEEILAANIAEIEKASAVEPAKAVIVEKYEEEEPILW
jgi:hypothetical protein